MASLSKIIDLHSHPFASRAPKTPKGSSSLTVSQGADFS